MIFTILRLLLDYGANPAGLNNQLDTPAHCAARAGNLNTLKLLVDKGGLTGLLRHRRQPSHSLPPSTVSFDNRSSFVTNGGHGSGRSTASAAVRTGGRRNRRRGAVAMGEAGGGIGSASRNLLSAACESEKPEVVEYLIEEIIKARRDCFAHGSTCSCSSNLASLPTASHSSASVSDASARNNSNVLNNQRRNSGLDPGLEGGCDPRQAVMLELGADLAASNTVMSQEEMEGSIYGRMLARTPRAFLYLLDSCVHANARDTYVDFFPFYNREGKSELNILKVSVVHSYEIQRAVTPYHEYDLLPSTIKVLYSTYLLLCCRRLSTIKDSTC